MKTYLLLASISAVPAILFLSACENTSHSHSHSPAPTDRTTPAGSSRGISPGNDVTDSGVPESPAAHKSKQR